MFFLFFVGGGGGGDQSVSKKKQQTWTIAIRFQYVWNNTQDNTLSSSVAQSAKYDHDSKSADTSQKCILRIATHSVTNDGNKTSPFSGWMGLEIRPALAVGNEICREEESLSEDEWCPSVLRGQKHGLNYWPQIFIPWYIEFHMLGKRGSCQVYPFWVKKWIGNEFISETLVMQKVSLFL